MACGRGDGDGQAAAIRSAYDSVAAERQAQLYDLDLARAELRAAREKKAYMVLDLERHLLRFKVAGIGFDSLKVGEFTVKAGDPDTVDLAALHHILAAEVISARPAKLEADTTVDKAAAILARIVPPRPKPLRFVVHAEDMSVRFTASDPKSPWEDLKLFVQRSWGSPPDSVSNGPRARVDISIEGRDLERLEHFLDRGMPLLIRFAPDDRKRYVHTPPPAGA